MPGVAHKPLYGQVDTSGSMITPLPVTQHGCDARLLLRKPDAGRGLNAAVVIETGFDLLGTLGVQLKIEQAAFPGDMLRPWRRGCRPLPGVGSGPEVVLDGFGLTSRGVGVRLPLHGWYVHLVSDPKDVFPVKATGGTAASIASRSWADEAALPDAVPDMHR